MKKYVDSKIKDAEFEVGRWVWAKMHYYKQPYAAKRLNFKLAKRYFRPFFITARIGKVAYRLELPTDCKTYAACFIAKTIQRPTVPSIYGL